MTAKRQIRCALYTRKSSEEGLEQEFNSLDAQREACAAYVTSQKAEGWVALRGHYDDGGYSGGTLDRPALQRLLKEIEAGGVDVVVVYKIDRLSRSLMDFAKLVEVFDRRNVTFVSVTQSFNTTTSMGRLTLNVLLSFAQFEREVTGERIRDKFAASKKKGMWMGGTPPLGYDICERKLIVNEAEAKTVGLIFQRYLELGCVRALRNDLRTLGIVSKIWTSRSGKQHGNQPFDRGALYCLLKNRAYLGETMHKGTAYPGEHQAIVPKELFDQVQDRLAESRHRTRRARNASRGAPLAGLIFDDRGNPMTPTYSRKPGGQEYRYYVSSVVITGTPSEAGSIPRVPAQAIEDIVDQYLRRLVLGGSPTDAGDTELANPSDLSAEPAGRHRVIKRIEIHARSITLHLDRDAVLTIWHGAQDPDEAATEKNLIAHHIAQLGQGETFTKRDDTFVLTIPIRAKFRGGRAQLQSQDGRMVPLAPRVDPALLKAISRAHVWSGLLATGEATSIEELADRVKQDRGYVARVMRLAFLAPSIIAGILDGRQSADMTLSRLLDADIPLSWARQAAAL
jgi:site-specific DNA recombinase